MPGVYISANSVRHEETHQNADVLSAFGYVISSRWHDNYGRNMPSQLGPEDIIANIDFCDGVARSRIGDLSKADIFLLVTYSHQDEIGEMDTEFGVAIGLSKRIIIVGPKANVFHSIKEFEYHASREDFINHVRSINAASTSGSPSAASSLEQDEQGITAGN
jgi:hypothetical protein